MNIDGKNKYFLTVELSFSWSAMEFLWERERTQNEEQVGFGNYKSSV